MKKSFLKKTLIITMMSVMLIVFAGITVNAGNPGPGFEFEDQDPGSTGTQIINTYETVYINYESFYDTNFSYSQYYYFEIYIERPDSTHAYVDETNYLVLKPTESNYYFTNDYYVLDGYINFYEFEELSEGTWLVNYDGDLRILSHESINNFHTSTSSFFEWTFHDVYSSKQTFKISEVIFNDITTTNGTSFFPAYTKGGTHITDNSFIFMDCVYYEGQGFGNYYIVDNGNNASLVQVWNVFFGFRYQLTIDIDSNDLIPGSENIDDVYFVDFY
jgi:hypothetical protein